MKAHFDELAAEPDDPDAGSVRAEANAATNTACSGAEALDLIAEAAPGASQHDTLALELGDFLARIPPSYLRAVEIPPRWPLVFDLGGVADRIARGITTIPLVDLMKMAPDLFEDLAPVERALEIRFPWAKVMALMKESDANATATGEETLVQRLNRRRKANEPKALAAAELAESAVVTPELSQIQGRMPLDQLKISFRPAKDLSSPPANAAAEPAPIGAPDLLFHEESPVVSAAAAETERQILEAKVKALEAQLTELSGKRERDALTLRATHSLVEQLRAEAQMKEAQFAAEFSGELERLLAQKDEQVAELEAKYSSPLASQNAEVSPGPAADEKSASPAQLEIDAKQKSELETECERLRQERQEALQRAAEAEAALAGKEAEIAALKTEHETALSASEAAWEQAIAQIDEEHDALAQTKESLAAEHAQHLSKITQDFEAVLASLRSDAERKADEVQSLMAAKDAEIAALKTAAVTERIKVQAEREREERLAEHQDSLATVAA
jgi:hypothetical protein